MSSSQQTSGYVTLGGKQLDQLRANCPWCHSDMKILYMRAPSGHRNTCPHRSTWAAGPPDADLLPTIVTGLGITTVSEPFYSGPGGRTTRYRKVYQVSTARFPEAAAILQSTQPAAAAPASAAPPAVAPAASASAQRPAMTADQQEAYGRAYYAIQQRLAVGWHLSQMTSAPPGEGHSSVAWTAAWAAHAAQRRQ